MMNVAVNKKKGKLSGAFEINAWSDEPALPTVSPNDAGKFFGVDENGDVVLMGDGVGDIQSLPVRFDVVGGNVFIDQSQFTQHTAGMPTTARDVWYIQLDEVFNSSTDATAYAKNVIDKIATQIENLIAKKYNVFFLVSIPSAMTVYNGLTPYISNVPINISNSSTPKTIIGERFSNGRSEIRTYLSAAYATLPDSKYAPTLNLDINLYSTTVFANPSAAATAQLTKIRIGDTIYSIGS